MKYLEVKGAGRLEAEGQRRRDSGSTSRRGRPIRSLISFSDLVISFFDSAIRWFWLSTILELSILGLWVRFFSLDFRLGFFLSFKRRPLVFENLISVYWDLVFFFFFKNSWVCYCNLLGLLYLVFFFRLGLLYRLMLGFFSSGLALWHFFFFKF